MVASRPSPTFVELTDADVAGIKTDAVASVRHKGKMSNMPLVRRITLADGRKLYKCAMCNYANTNPGSITPHQRAHPIDVRAAKARELGMVGYAPSTVTVKNVAAAAEPKVRKKRGPYKKRTTNVVASEPTPITVDEIARGLGDLNGAAEVFSSLEAFVATRNQELTDAHLRIARLEDTIRQITGAAQAVVPL
jgi:hypothetical protein